MSRTELDYAMHYGTTTCFYRDRMPEVLSAIASEGFHIDTATPSKFSTLDPALQHIYRDSAGISALFNSKDANFTFEVNHFQEFVVSIGSRLNRFHPLHHEPLDGPLEAFCHIGLVAFVSTLFLQSGYRGYAKYALVAQCMRDTVERGIPEGYDDVMLWLLFMGGISGLEELCGRAWLGARIRRTAQSLGIGNWIELRDVLRRFPWISCHHDDGGKALWEAATRVGGRL
jgi:hypothetical protein